MRKVSTILFLISAMPLAMQALAAGTTTIQCWTDDKGNRSCGDHVPPQFAKQERDIYNSQGVVVDKKSRQKTAEEIADDERKAADDAAAAKHVQDQLAYDKFLTDTYGSSKEIEDARDLRVQTVDGRMALAQKAISDNQKALLDLQSRMDVINKAGKQPPQSLVDQVKKFQLSLQDSKNAVTDMQSDKQKMVAKFNDDIDRYKILRPGH